jgi:hypothetical protein
VRDGTPVATQRITLQLELDPQSSPFTGAIEADGGERVPFVGWLGLAQVLEQVLVDARDAKQGGGTAADPSSATTHGGKA